MARKRKKPAPQLTDANIDRKGFGAIPRALVESKAYRTIKTLAAAKALPVFLIKWASAEARGEAPVCEFTYTEANLVHGIPKKSFSRGLVELHSLGFIDVVDKGGVWEGNRWSKSIYRLTFRWKMYGSPDFVTPPWMPSEPSARSNHLRKKTQ